MSYTPSLTSKNSSDDILLTHARSGNTRAMSTSAPITYARVLKLAWPASIASLITPLLGLIDATVLGYSARPLDVGAVGLAAAIFTLAYWTFGFLRMSTAGLTAQAVGAGDEAKARRILAQSTGLGGIIGLLFVILQIPFGLFAFWLMSRGSTVETATVDAAEAYYAIRIWGGALCACYLWCTGLAHGPRAYGSPHGRRRRHDPPQYGARCTFCP